MDAAGVRRLGRGDRAQHDLGASAALVARARHRGTRSARLPRLAAGPPPAGRRVSGFKFPHPLVLLVAGTALAAAASWVLPAGQYERRDDPVTGRRVVVAGTYHAVPPHPVGPWRALVAIPKGMADAASVIFFVFLIGGAFTVVDRTGALRGAVDWLVRRLARRDALVIPAACLTFALGGPRRAAGRCWSWSWPPSRAWSSACCGTAGDSMRWRRCSALWGSSPACAVAWAWAAPPRPSWMVSGRWPTRRC